jgi:hypothetical protein
MLKEFGIERIKTNAPLEIESLESNSGRGEYSISKES